MSDDAAKGSNEAPAGAGRVSAVVRVCNVKGLHARASARFVNCAEGFDATISVTRDGQTVPATSIMGLMMLAAGPGSSLEIVAEGPGAAQAVTALVDLVRSGFGEDRDGVPPRSGATD